MPASSDTPATPERTVFRLPRTAYLVVLFLFIGVIPFALSGNITEADSGEAKLSPFVALFLIPLLAAVFIARTATVVDADGITVRALLGSRAMPWSAIRGINISGSRVLAVLDEGLVRLPCVQISHLSALAEASHDHLPSLPRPLYKQPPTRQRRR